MNPVTVNTAGAASDAFSGVCVTDPDVQVSATDTAAALFGMKSLFTVTVALLSVLVMVQLPPTATPTQPVWFAV